VAELKVAVAAVAAKVEAAVGTNATAVSKEVMAALEGMEAAMTPLAALLKH